MPSNFWNDVNVEPKRSFRWVGYINFYKPSGGGGTLSEAASIKPFLVSSWSPPTFEIEDTQTINKFGGFMTNRTKNFKWSNVTINIIDIESGDGSNASKGIYGWLQSLGYNARNFSTAAPVNEFIQSLSTADITALSLERIDALGKPYEKWKFLKPVITNIMFGDLFDYGSDDINKVELEFLVNQVERVDDSSALAEFAGATDRLVKSMTSLF